MRKMKVKNRRKQRLWILKLSLFLLLFSFSFCTTLGYFSRNLDNTSFMKLLLQNSNGYMEIKKEGNIFLKLIKMVASIDFKNPKTLLKKNYVMNKSSSSSPNVDADGEKDLDSIPTSNYIKDPYEKKEIKDPIVYLYNSHQSEEYATSNVESYNVRPTVMMSSYILREKLNKNGIATIVEENDVTEFLRTNNWNYASSYKVTKLLMEDAKEKNPTLTYYIDLHRDSVSRKVSATTIDGKNYAKILFLIGLENQDYAKNLAMTEKINNAIQEKYPGLSRGIYKKQGPGVNGVYNQDFSPNTILIEIGGQDNTIDEVFNTCEAISEVLTKYIKEDQNEG